MLKRFRRHATRAVVRGRLLRKSRQRLDGILTERPEIRTYRLPQGVTERIESMWPDRQTIRTVVAWTKAYASINGIVDHRYVPGFAFAAHLRGGLNHEELAGAYTDKNVMDRLFPDAPTPPIFVRRVHGRTYGPSMEPLVDVERALNEWDGQEMVVKPALDSGGGRGVWIGTYRAGSFEREGEEGVPHHAFLARRGANLVVQAKIQQHVDVARFHPASVNTLRVLTLRHDPDLVVLSTVTRFGEGGSRVDNQAAGGVSCGVRSDGRLNDFAVDKRGRAYERHPTTNVPFAGATIPGVREAHDLVVRLHGRLLHFDVVSWDVAIGVDGAPVLLEFNLWAQELAFHQMNNGPLFGDLTEAVLQRAFDRGA